MKIHIAGLGPYMRQEFFSKLLEKNPRSKFYNSPNAYDMMKVFNDILTDSTGTLLGLNSLESYQGINYDIKEFTISGQGNLSHVSVIWSDGRYHYTFDYPDKNNINIVLINPDGKQLDTKPVIVDDGYCIFELCNVRPGTWHVLSQYAVDHPIWCTIGVLEKDSPVIAEITGKQIININEQIGYEINISNADMLRSLSVNAVYSSPALDVKMVMDTLPEYSNILEHSLADADHRLFQRKRTYGSAIKRDNGSFIGNMGTASNTGIYNACFTLKGVYKDGTPFSCCKMHSVIVK